MEVLFHILLVAHSLPLSPKAVLKKYRYFVALLGSFRKPLYLAIFGKKNLSKISVQPLNYYLPKEDSAKLLHHKFKTDKIE